MIKQKRRLAWLLALVAALGLLAGACGSSDDDTKADKTTTTSADGDGSTTTAPADIEALKAATAKLDGGGSSFQDTFEQQVSSDFGAAVKEAGGSGSVTYTKSGSSDGKKALADKTLDFAGTDSPIKDEEKASFGDRQMLYFPITGGPIALAYKLDGVSDLQLSPDTVADIFQGKITTWDDDAIKADNPDADLPSTKITVVHRSDGSGTTSNFTKYLVAAAPDTWKLDAGETVNWPASTQGAEKSTGVISVVASTDGAIGYADLADAAKENLDVAKVKNAAGNYIAPTPDAAAAAIASAEVADDLTYSPLNAEGDDAYPITSPTWILVDAKQSDQAKADTLKAYLTYVLTTGQEQAKSLFYAPLPKELLDKAVAQIEQITVG